MLLLDVLDIKNIQQLRDQLMQFGMSFDEYYKYKCLKQNEELLEKLDMIINLHC